MGRIFEGLGLAGRPIALAVAFCGLAAAAHAGSAQDQVLQRRIGPSAIDGFALAEGLRAMDPPGADAMLRYLLEAFVDQAAGKAHDPNLTVADAVQAGRSLQPVEKSPDLQSRWTEALKARVGIALPAASRPLPPELEADAPRLKELAPGIWMSAATGARRSTLYVAPLLTNRTQVPMPLWDFALRAGSQLVFLCEPERGRIAPLLAPGATAGHFTCRAPGEEDGAARVRELAAQPHGLQLEGHEFDNAKSAAWVARTLAALGGSETEAIRNAIDAEEARKREQRGERKAAVEQKHIDIAKKTQAVEAEFVRSPRMQQVMLFSKVTGFVLGYWALAWWFGNAGAAFAYFMLGMANAILVVAGGPSVFTPESPAGQAHGYMHLLTLAIPFLIAIGMHTLYRYTMEDRKAVLPPP